MNCEYEVKPLPYEFCQRCLLNGCYPWSKSPAFRCSLNNGFVVALITATTYLSPEEEIVSKAVSNEVHLPACETFKGIDESLWITWVKDMKKEADEREQIRLKAMTQKIRSNQKEDALIF